MESLIYFYVLSGLPAPTALNRTYSIVHFNVTITSLSMKFLKSQGVMIDVKPKKKVVICTYASRLTGPTLYMLLTGVSLSFQTMTSFLSQT